MKRTLPDESERTRLLKLLASSYANEVNLTEENERLRHALKTIEKGRSGTWRDLFEWARRTASEALDG